MTLPAPAAAVAPPAPRTRINTSSWRQRACALVVGALATAAPVPAPLAAQPVTQPASRAAELTQAAGDADTLSAPAAYLSGRHAHAEGDLWRAFHFLDRAQALRPDDTTLAARLFLVALATGHIGRAAEVSTAIGDSPRLQPLSALARVAAAVRAGRPEVAAEIDLGNDLVLFRGALDDLIGGWLDPTGEAGRRAVASLLGRDPDQPEAELPPSLALAGEDPVAQGGAAVTPAPDGNPLPVSSVNLMHAGLILLARGETQAARALLQRSLGDQASLRQARFAAAAALADGDRDAALAAYEAIALPQDSAIDLTAERARVAAGEVPYALPQGAAGGLAEVYFDLATLSDSDQGSEWTLAFVQMALYLRPDHDLGWLLLGDTLIARERWLEARDILLSVAADSPLSWMARLRASDALALAEHTQEAMALLESMVAERPGRLDALMRLGDLQRGERQFDAAAATYTQAIDTLGEAPEQRHWALYYARAVALERADRWQEAEADFLQALELNPDQPMVLNYLGYSWLIQDRNLEQALEMIQRAVDQRPRDGMLIDSLGWAHYKLGNYAEALKHLERAVSLEPDEPEIIDHLGDVLWRLGRQREAEFQWRRALNLSRDSETPVEPDMIPSLERKLEAGL